MFQAITTRYLGPCNVLGSRVKASCEAGSVTLTWNHALNTQKNHIAAAKALATKLEWYGYYVGGGMDHLSHRGYAFVSITHAHERTDDEVTFDYDFAVIEAQSDGTYAHDAEHAQRVADAREGFES